MIFAAIDIGSNAVRLLFSHVHEQKGKVIFKKGELIRLPIRLGDDAFVREEISKEKVEKLVTAMKGFFLYYVFFFFFAFFRAAMRIQQRGGELLRQSKALLGIVLRSDDGCARCCLF